MFELLHYLICLVSVFTDAIVAVYLAMRSNATLEEACLDLFGMYFAFTDTRGAWRLVIRQPKAPKEGELAAAPRKDVASTFYLHLFHMVCKVLDVLIPMYHEVAAIRTPLNGLYISATSIELAWSLLNAGWLLSRIGLTTVYIFLITLRTMLAVLHKGLRLLRSTVRRPSILMKSDQLQSDFFPKLASELRKMVYDNALEPVLNPGKSSPYPCPSGHVCPHHDNTWRIPVPNILLVSHTTLYSSYWTLLLTFQRHAARCTTKPTSSPPGSSTPSSPTS